MTIVWIILGSIILCSLMALVGHRIKDKENLFAKISTAAVAASLFGAIIFFYGSSLIQSIKFNINSLEDIKNLLGSRFIAFIAMILVYIFMFLKVCLIIKFTFAYRKHSKDFIFIMTVVVLDIAVIPNILTLGLVSILYICISLLLNGLACVKLVFSISSKPKLTLKEGGAY